MLLIPVDRQAPSPLYVQIVRQVRRLIEDGHLATGTRLPPTRALAERLGVDRTTVYQAYQELWALGFIESRPGSYTRVRQRPAVVRPAVQARPSGGLIDWGQAVAPGGEQVFHKLRRWQTGTSPDNGSGQINLSRLDLDGRLFPLEAFRRCTQHALLRYGESLFHYGDPQGFKPLREFIAERSRIHGMNVEAEEVLITNGSQQAIDLVFRLLATPGKPVAIEVPTYSNVLPQFEYTGSRVMGIPMGPEGLDLENFRQRLAVERPSFLYTIPNFQNPTGITTSQQHREQLLHLCEEHRLPLVEDGFDEEMKYFGRVSLPVKSMDRHQVVIYLSTFSKVLFPGIRIGWIIAPRPCLERLAMLKRCSDLSSSGPLQAAIYEFCRREHYDFHVRRMHREFRKRMQTALETIREQLPAGQVTWTEPAGGYLIWVSFRQPAVDEERFARCCREQGVVVSPGAYYFPLNEPLVHFRISISMLTGEEIREGIVRLGRAIRAMAG